MSDVQAMKISYRNKALDLERFYLDETTSDVKFTFKLNDDQEETVWAHRIVLAARSDVFHAMFYGEVKEKGDVEIVDASPAVFREFLKFFYHSKIELTMENVSGVMGLGNKYNVAACLHACSILLKKNLTVDSACFIYGLAILYDEDELKKLCQDEIIMNTEAVLASSSFLECSKPVLRHILDLNTLSCSEVVVFKACMDWVKSGTGEEKVTKDMIEHYLGELFYQIRFRSMTFQAFANLIPTFGDLFSFDEHKECVQLIGSKDFQPKLFTTLTRQQHGNDCEVIECNRITEYIERYCGTQFVQMTFSTNESITLTGLVFESLCIYREGKWRDDLIEDLETEITITKISGNKGERVLSNEAARLRCGNETVVILAKPILARPRNKYKIELNHTFNGHWYKMATLKTSVQLDPSIVIQFHDDLVTQDVDQIPCSPIIALRFMRILE